MTNQAFVYTYKTKFGTFRIQPHKDKFALFIDYPQGDWDLKTTCVSVEDGVDYVSHQDTGVREWDDLDSIPDNVCLHGACCTPKDCLKALCPWLGAPLSLHKVCPWSFVTVRAKGWSLFW